MSSGVALKIRGGRNSDPFIFLHFSQGVLLFHLVQDGARPHPHSSQGEEEDAP